MCYYQDKLPDFFDQLGLKFVEFTQRKNVKYIVYKNDNLELRAKELAFNIESMVVEDKEYHYMMGDYLGYPKEDVDYFVYRK